ncbi:MAG: (d)CMP kinase [Candidatus Tumulicola sp.]
MTFPPALQIAIDGPAASGKTTVARLVAKRLGIPCLDTGAMYRALAYLALQTDTGVGDGEALAGLVDAANAQTFTEAMLQHAGVTAVVSTVAAHPQVRAAMVEAQRRIAGRDPIVMTGRDIGTVVLPNAAVKIYLTATATARAARRREQLQEAGTDARDVRHEIEERDRVDSTRAVSPLEPAPDAHTIDSSDLPVQRVVDEICAIAARAKTLAR